MDPAELTAQTRWLRPLAQRLVRDNAAAEDLLQDLWLTTMTKGGAGKTRRPWLARVLINLAAKRRRSELRRQGREARAVSDVAVPSAADVAQRLEAQRLVLNALASLPEPLRTAIVLRYQDELPHGEIAAKLGIPEGTVRWRVHEGLARLRVALDQHYGQREGWALALMPLLPSSSWGLGSPALSSLSLTLLMNVGHKLLGVAVVGLALLGFYLLRAPALPEDSIQRPPDPRVEAASSVAAVSTVTPSDSARLEVARPAEGTATAQSRPRLILGRVVSNRQTPIADAEVALQLPSASTRTDAAGRFELPLDAEVHGPRTLIFRAAGYARQFHGVTATHGDLQVGDIVLNPGCVVRGRVRDSAGKGIARVQVVIARPLIDVHRWSSPKKEPESAEGESGVDGSFEIQHAPVGMVQAWALVRDLVGRTTPEDWIHCKPFELQPPANQELVELVVSMADSIKVTELAGVVVSPDGQPVPQAMVAVDARYGVSSIQDRITCDAEGRFRYDAHTQATATLTATDPKGRWRGTSLADIRTGTQGIRMQLLPQRWVDLEVLAARDGERLDTFATQVVQARGNWLLETVTGQSGRARVAVPLERFQLQVLVDGHAALEFGPFDPDSCPSTLQGRLRQIPGVQGRVLVAGQAIAGAKVELLVQLPQTLGSAGQATVSFPFVMSPTLSGKRFRTQWVTVDSAPSIRTSNGLDHSVPYSATGTPWPQARVYVNGYGNTVPPTGTTQALGLVTRWLL